jgi:Holliday junction resolvase
LRSEGYEVAEEAPVGGGKTVDLLAVRGGKRIAFEVETGKSDAAANVRKCLEAGVDRVVVFATSRAAYERLKSSLPADPRVRVVAASDTERLSAMEC